MFQETEMYPGKSFKQFYIEPLKKFNLDDCEFIIGDFSEPIH
jgi:hypothetical protein